MLRCEPSPGTIEDHTIEIETDPGIAIAPPGAGGVVFRYVADPFWWVNRWFSLQHADGGLIMAGMDADSILPPGKDPGQWYSTMDVGVQGDLCPWTEDSCGIAERQALDVTYRDWNGLALDGDLIYLGPTMSAAVVVGHATSYMEMWCEDAPMSWYSAFLYVRPGE
jgi:hypothetical protein